MNPRLKLTIVLVFAMGLLWATGANAQFLTVLNSILTLLDVPESVRQILYGAIILLLAAAYNRLID